MALKQVRFEQKLRQAVVEFRVAKPLPRLRKLRRYPGAIDADGRHMCLVADGPAVRRRLICPGGELRNPRIRVGISRYAKSGRANKLRSTWARVDRPSPRRLRLTVALKSLGMERGRFRYWATSAWRGAACKGPGSRDGSCHSRAPAKRRLKGRVAPVVRSGCTPGKGGVVTRGSTRRKLVALTFDDGPSAYTEGVLRALDRAGAKATFFVLGSLVPGRASVLRKMVAGGHEIANHSWNHEFYSSGSSMARTNSAVRSATGFTPCHFRPPGGAFNSGTVATARAHGMSLVMWNVDTRDWTGLGVGSIISSATSGGRGSIVLMHDGGGPRSATLAAVPHIIEALKKRGYKLVTMTQLLGGRFKLREKD